MAHWITACEWCGKAMDFLTELKKTILGRCDKCNIKTEKVILNDCYPQIKESLEKGKWVVGNREISGMYGGIEKDFIIFVFLSNKGKGFIRGTRSRENINDALSDLFSTPWNRENINQFGFNELIEMDPITKLK